MDNKEKKTFLQARLRNLKRKYAKLVQHSDLTEEAIEVKSEMDGIERQLKLLQ